MECFSELLFVFWVFDEPKNGILVGLDKADGTNEDEIRKDGFSFSLVDMGQFLEFLQCDFFVFRQMAQEQSLRVSESDFGGSGKLVGLPHLN